MAQDFLRSCFRRKVRLTDGSNREVWVRWYFVGESPRILPPLSAFSSSVWEPVDATLGPIGDADRVLVWDKGNNPGYPGKCFAGEPAWFADGLPADIDLTPLPRLLCGRYTLFGTGGVEWDGSASMIANRAIVGRGGLDFGGTATFQDQMIGSGGIEFDGSAQFQGLLVGSGGVEFGGSAEFMGMLVGSGGVEFGGTAMMGTGVIRSCCPNHFLPRQLKFTVANVSGCACINGLVLTANYNVGFGSWSANGPTGCISAFFPPFPANISFGFQCGTTSCNNAGLTTQFDFRNSVSVVAQPGCTCDPPHWEFLVTLHADTNCPNAVIRVTVGPV